MKRRELISPPLEWPRMKLHKSRSARWLRTPLWPRLRGARRARHSRNRWVALVVRECGASNCVSAPWAERFYLRQASGENRLFCYKDVGTRLRKLPQVFFVRVEGWSTSFHSESSPASKSQGGF